VPGYTRGLGSIACPAKLTGHDPAAEISARFEEDEAAEGSQ
jgi:hypothetical protein